MCYRKNDNLIYWTQCHWTMFPKPKNKSWTQTCISCPVKINESMQHQHTISYISQTIVDYALQILEYIFWNYQVNLPWLKFLTMNRRKVFTAKYILGLVLTRYMKDPINCLHQRIYQIWIQISMQLHMWHHRSGHEFTILHLESFQDLNCVFSLPKVNFTYILSLL